MYALPVGIAFGVRAQQRSDEGAVSGLICLGVLFIVALTFGLLQRHVIRKQAAAVGTYEATISVARPPDEIVSYIKKNFDHTSKGKRDWAKRWVSRDPPTVILSTWYLKYWDNCLAMILLGILPYFLIQWTITGGRTEKITVTIMAHNGGSAVQVESVGKVGYEEAEKLVDALGALV